MIYNSAQWFRDVDAVTEGLDLREMEGRNILITGAAGLICSAVTDILIRYNETHPQCAPIGILAAGRWQQEMEDRFGAYAHASYFRFVPYDASRTDNRLDLPAQYVLHGANNAFPAMVAREPVETMLGNFLGIRDLLEYARRQPDCRVLYISSSEVYGKKADDVPFRENEYGFVDLLDPRNSYSVGKRAAETLCASYAAEYGVHSVIARPGHIYGPTAGMSDNRVASAWAYAAARGEPIVMKSDGAQIRSYVYCADCAAALLTILLRGETAQAYNIADPMCTMSIRALAQALCDAAGVPLDMQAPTAAEKRSFNPMRNSSLESGRLQALGWRCRFDGAQGLAHTVAILRERIGTLPDAD